MSNDKTPPSCLPYNNTHHTSRVALLFVQLTHSHARTPTLTHTCTRSHFTRGPRVLYSVFVLFRRYTLENQEEESCFYTIVY